MNVSLTPELERFIEKRIRSGMYQTASEVVREGLRLLHERDALYAEKLESLRADIAKGMQQADRGELLDGAEVFRDLRRHGRKRGRKAG